MRNYSVATDFMRFDKAAFDAPDSAGNEQRLEDGNDRRSIPGVTDVTSKTGPSQRRRLRAKDVRTSAMARPRTTKSWNGEQYESPQEREARGTAGDPTRGPTEGRTSEQRS